MLYTEDMNETSQGTPREPYPEKRYRFRFSPLILTLLCLGLVLCAASFALTTWQLIGFLQAGDLSSVYDWLKYVILYLVSVLVAVLFIAMLIRSEYVLTDSQLLIRFGVIVSKYDLKKIFSIQHFRGSNKLTVYFDDFKTKFMVIVVKAEWYDDFVKSLLERNERIAFDFITAEEENNLKKKK